ncbi:acyltransferase domain-containing protein [Streptomyces ferrugineus]|uniref:Acyltransferase domain-containing protein n=1 Tax=Streptomyces ferrugineus TaxID=1413221 RepID=A0A7M2SH85_9ACTN|nr:acyltransferase domain-containing protein [Streptomyces ferrugineus]QOV35706.1 acyltransferase domain-containing protein [Streptomyces ferrugineus]
MPVPEPDHSRTAHCEWLLERLAHYLGRPVEETVPLSEYGLDSVLALSLYGDIEAEFGPLVGPDDIWAHETVRDFARYMASRDARRGGHRVRSVFVFTGQGCQHPGMTAGLYLNSASYRRHLDAAAAALLPHTGLSVVDLILDKDPRLHLASCAQPALFAVEYALARTLQDAGVTPAAVLGHGIGEFAAAAVAGAVGLADAAQLVALRGAFTQRLPPGGGMTAACITAREAAELVADEPRVGIGAVNAAKSTVLSGQIAALERVEARLASRGVRCRRLAVAHAFHSPLMKPMAAEFTAAARRLSGGIARLPFYSTVYGRLETGPLYAPYWAEQLTSPVRFADAARGMLAQQAPTHIVEIGPRAVLIPYLRRMGGPVCIPVCQGPDSDAVDLAGVISALDAGPLAAELAGA